MGLLFCPLDIKKAPNWSGPFLNHQAIMERWHD